MADFVMPVAFYFTVSAGAGSSEQDMAFQEVSGLESEIETETVAEGGENRFVHRLPKSVKHKNLVFKRGVAEKSSPIATWCRDVLEKDFALAIVPKEFTVSLCDGDGEAIRRWSVANAWPVKWSISAFDAMKNEIAIESMEFAYNTLEMKPLGG